MSCDRITDKENNMNDKRRFDVPKCPVCGDEMIPVRQERVTWTEWATRWHCRRCRTEHLVPVIHDGEDDGDDADA